MQDLSDFNTYAIENTRNAVFKPLNDWNNAENQKSSEVTAGSLLRNLFVGVVGNVVGDGLILGTYDAALHPVRTYKGIETIMGLAQGLEPENVEFIDNLMKATSKGWDDFWKADGNTKVLQGTEVLGNLALIFAPAAKAGAVSKVSTISKIEKTAVVAEDLAKIGKTAEMGNLSRGPLKLGIQFFGGKGAGVAEVTGDVGNAVKLPVQAGEAGSYGDLAARAVRGDKLTPHHMPQAAAHFTPYSEGGSLVLPESEHFLTRTFGGRGIATIGEDAGLTFRQILYKDIKDIRSIAGSKYNDGLMDLLGYYKQNFPELMKK